MEGSVFLKVWWVLAPIPVMLLIGFVLRKTKAIGKGFVTEGNRVVYYVCLPALIILKFISAEQGFKLNLTFLQLFLGFTVFNFLVALAITRYFNVGPKKRLPFIVASFRGNLAIFALAVLEALISGDALANSILTIGAAMILYNVLTVLVFPKENGQSKSIFSFLTNPLILSMIIGGLLQYSAVYIPIVMLTSLEYCAGATFPLAFIIMGATLRMSLKFKWEVWGCAALKTLVTPALSTAVISYFSILSGDHLVAFFILVGSPAAAITIAISSVTSSDDFFAAEVVGLSIILSFVFVTLGLSIL